MRLPALIQVTARSLEPRQSFPLPAPIFLTSMRSRHLSFRSSRLADLASTVACIMLDPDFRDGAVHRVGCTRPCNEMRTWRSRHLDLHGRPPVGRSRANRSSFSHARTDFCQDELRPSRLTTAPMCPTSVITGASCHAIRSAAISQPLSQAASACARDTGSTTRLSPLDFIRHVRWNSSPGELGRDIRRTKAMFVCLVQAGANPHDYVALWMCTSRTTLRIRCRRRQKAALPSASLRPSLVGCFPGP